MRSVGTHSPKGLPRPNKAHQALTGLGPGSVMASQEICQRTVQLSGEVFPVSAFWTFKVLLIFVH